MEQIRCIDEEEEHAELVKRFMEAEREGETSKEMVEVAVRIGQIEANYRE